MKLKLYSLPQKSLGSRLIQSLGGIDAYCKLPKLAWKPEYGPHMNYGIQNHGYWDIRGVCHYKIDPKDLPHKVMQGRDNRGRFVLLLRKEVTTDSGKKNANTFQTVEVITPSIYPASRGSLSSFHNDDEKNATPWVTHIHVLDSETTLSRISKLMKGEKVVRDAKEFDPGYPSPAIPFKNISEQLK